MFNELYSVTTGRRRSAITATDLMAELENDQEFQRRRRALDAVFQARAEALRQAEQPIVAELQAVGVDVGSIWDLVNTSEPYPAALPVLMDHLERGGYPERVMESLGRALAVKPSVTFWDRLKARWIGARDQGEETGAALALAACATKAQLDDVIGFLAVTERGESRIFFIKPLCRFGGDRGREVVEALRDDPVLGREATALLKRSSRIRRP